MQQDLQLINASVSMKTASNHEGFMQYINLSLFTIRKLLLKTSIDQVLPSTCQ